MKGSLLALLIAFLFFWNGIASPAASGDKNNLTVVIINNRPLFMVEKACTVGARVQGLSGRKELADDKGMLFVFQDKKTRNFWMKDMHFGLDILFINNGRIMEIITLPKPAGGVIPSCLSRCQADQVLEINAGMAGKLGIHPGDRLTERRGDGR
ncbi:MAG: DUF192 domain-containing protein [bacterium]